MEAVAVAVITACGVVGAAWVQFRRLRTENREQHAEGRVLLTTLVKGQDRIETKIDTHLGWHAGHGDVPSPDVGID